MIHEELLKIPQYKIILLNTFGVTVFFPLVFSCLHFIAFIGYTEHKQRIVQYQLLFVKVLYVI